MEDSELLNLWKSYDKKLDENLRINRKNAEDITKIKARSILVSTTPLKLFAIVVGIIWVVFVDTLIVNLFAFASPFFLVSAVIQVLLTKLAIGIYLYQIILIRAVDINEPILDLQQKLAGMKSSTLWVPRILFLQLPVWTTFYISKGMLQNGSINLKIIQLLVVLIFTALALWLFFNIKYENRNKKWFRLIFQGKEWDSVLKAMDLAKEAGEYKSGNY